MKHIKNFAALSLALWVFASILGNAVTRPNLSGPIAIHRSSDTEFYVLSSDGSVRRLRNTGTGFKQSGEFSIQGFPVDFTYSVSDQVASLFVCSTQLGKSAISRYAVDGSVMQRWWLWHPCGGVDFDYSEQVLYVAGTDDNGLYRLDIRTNDQPQSVGELPSGHIGPIVVVPGRKLIYVGNVSEGVVYEYDITTRKFRNIAANLGSPISLAYDPDNRLLYVVDGTRSRVLSLSLDAAGVKPTKPQVRVILKDRELHYPTSVARDSKGDLIISDSYANRIFAVSIDGVVKFRYPP